MNHIFENKILIPGNKYFFVRKKKYKYNKQRIFYATFIEISKDTLKIEKYTDNIISEDNGYWTIPIFWIYKIYSIEDIL